MRHSPRIAKHLDLILSQASERQTDAKQEDDEPGESHDFSLAGNTHTHRTYATYCLGSDLRQRLTCVLEDHFLDFNSVNRTQLFPQCDTACHVAKHFEQQNATG